MKDKCIITTVRDEGAIFDLWLGYYAKLFDVEDIFIIDDGSTDGSLDALPEGVHVERLEGVGQAGAANSLAPIVGERIKTLLSSYRCVTFAEADDFLIADPLIYPDGMQQMYEKFLADDTRKLVTFEGWGVIQDLENETALEVDKPWLSQRKNWIRIPKWDNTLVFKTPPRFRRGYHYADKDYLKVPADGCVLIDAHYIDFDLCQKRHKQRKHTYTNKTEYHVETADSLKLQFEERLLMPGKFFHDSQRLVIGERFKTIL